MGRARGLLKVVKDFSFRKNLNLSKVLFRGTSLNYGGLYPAKKILILQKKNPRYYGFLWKILLPKRGMPGHLRFSVGENSGDSCKFFFALGILWAKGYRGEGFKVIAFLDFPDVLRGV